MVSNHLRYPNLRPWQTNTTQPPAFALVRPQRVQEFHLSPLHSADSRRLCSAPDIVDKASMNKTRSPQAGAHATGSSTAATPVYSTGAGITAAAGTRLALPYCVSTFKVQTIAKTQIAPATLSDYLLPKEWVIYAPAAFLRCGSRFSGSLSGIEP